MSPTRVLRRLALSCLVAAHLGAGAQLAGGTATTGIQGIQSLQGGLSGQAVQSSSLAGQSAGGSRATVPCVPAPGNAGSTTGGVGAGGLSAKGTATAADCAPSGIVGRDPAQNATGRPGDGTGNAESINRPPPKPSEFQLFVAAATGQTLARFGQELFAGDAKGFEPLERTPVPVDYVIGPGDELHIRAWGAIDIDYWAVVDRSGQISLPKVGSMGVAGLKLSELEPYLRTQVRRLFTDFSLNVTMGQLRGIQVYVVGQARQPGTYTLSSVSSLLNAVFASGGPTGSGSMRQIELRRDGRLMTTLDLYDFIVKGSKGGDVRLQQGDVIVYKAAGPEVALLGALDQPAVYELKGASESLQAVLAYGGGLRASTSPQTVQLERIDPAAAPAPRLVQTFGMAEAGKTALKDGDVVTLFKVSPQFSNAVTLRGNVAAPLRYPFTPGMRVSTLIPERDALITPDYFVRKNKLVQFTEQRDVSLSTIERDVRNLLDEPNWEYAAVERMDPASLSLKLIPFNLAKAVIDHDPQNDLVLQPGDVVTIFGRNDMRAPVARQTRLVKVEGEVGAPGIYQVGANETLRDVLRRANGLTPQAYLYGLSFSRAATRRAQTEALADAVRRLEAQLASQTATLTANLSATDANAAASLQASQRELRTAQLGRLKTLVPTGRISLELPTDISAADALPDLPLEDGDHITIPNRPGYVFAVGAVDNSNALIWRGDKPLRQYLDSAGLQPDADDDNVFVLRADGSVLRKSSGRGWFSGGRDIKEAVLMPGDTVVVPDKVARETFWTGLTRGLKDWSQILYQFGLSAAAIKTLQ